MIVERESVSPSDLNRKRFDSQISFVSFKQSVKGKSLYGDLAPPTTLKKTEGYTPVVREYSPPEKVAVPEK